MKKKILIVSSSLNTGGLEYCLVNFANRLDDSRYDVDLYLFNEGRTLLPRLKRNIHLLPDSPFYAATYNRPIGHACRLLLKQRQFGLLFYRLERFLRARLHLPLNTRRDWFFMKKAMLNIAPKYDVAIGFEEGTACYYVADCVNAVRKIGWIHTDLKMAMSNATLDQTAFAKLNYVCTVSENSKRSLLDLYPDFADKYRVFSLPTMLDYEKIDQMADEPCKLDLSVKRILSVGRLVELKGFHLCIRPLKRLLDEGFQVKWYIAGEGDMREAMEQLIHDAGVEENFILLGNCPNPYKYIKNADICVQPSSYEGFSIAVWEGKYLMKPVIATAIPSNQEMLADGENGVLIERTEEAIYQAVKQLLSDSGFCKKLGKSPAIGYEKGKNTMQEIEKILN